MKLILTLCIFAWWTSFGAYASDKIKIAIITSLDPFEGKNFFSPGDYNLQLKIEKEFLRRFDHNKFDLKMVHQAKLQDVWQILHDESFEGIFFVGHAGKEFVSQNGVIATPSVIADKDLDDIKNAFRSVSSNLKYLAIISCNSEEIINKFINEDAYENNPDLITKTFDGKIELFSALRNSIKLGQEIFTNNAITRVIYPAEPSNNARLVLQRSIPLDVREEIIYPVVVLANTQVIGFFPKGKPGEVQSINVSLEKVQFSHATTLVVDSGVASSRKKGDVVLGEIQFMTNVQECQLRAERNSRGIIIGIPRNFYKLKCLKD